jgi:dTDP-4-amino-4,6-dideoxygalactose transaminase
MKTPGLDQQTLSAVPLLDVNRGNDPLRDEYLEAIRGVCESGWFVGGPNCSQLEQEFAQYCQTDHAVGCASGSDALLLALMACDISAGDEVIVPSFTFFATASAVWRLGARPVFVDIDPDTYNINTASIEAKVTPRTKAIIPVHLFGMCAEMDAICELARHHDLFVIEDAAQAIGAEYHDKRAGSLGHIGCFSFYPTKNLGGFGDGGMLTTSDSQLSDRLRLLAGHGMRPRYHHSVVGINSRLDAIQAAVLRIKLKHVSRWTADRQRNAQRYRMLFAAEGVDDEVVLPTLAPGVHHVWNQYTVRVPGRLRDAARDHLTKARIGTEIYYPIPLHLQECFRDLGCARGTLPETERAAEEVLSLPIFPELESDEQRRVVAEFAEFFAAESTGKIRNAA